MYVGMSELECERDNLHAATQHLLRSKELGEHTGFPQNRYRWRVAMARIREAQGDLSGALDLLDEAERLYMSDFAPNVRPIAAMKAHPWRFCSKRPRNTESPRPMSVDSWQPWARLRTARRSNRV